LKYDPERYLTNEAEQILGHLGTLLESIAANPEIPVVRLEMLTNVERTRLLSELSGAPSVYSNEKCVHQLFEDQVYRSADSIAVEFAGERLTYRQLNDRANRLAHFLI